jgi:hypothetical protein
MVPLTADDALAIETVLSRDRLGTYQRTLQQLSTRRAITLYAWNAEVSGAFLLPQQVCEVAMRNAVSDALSSVYGPDWPWAAGFERSLPDPRSGFSLRRELCLAKAKMTQGETVRVVPELKFAFWIRLFTQRFDQRLWLANIHRLFPGLPAGLPAERCRAQIYEELECVRSIRNRIAHHEPIFARNLMADYQRMLRLVAWRCPRTAVWLDQAQGVRRVLDAKP